MLWGVSMIEGTRFSDGRAVVNIYTDRLPHARRALAEAHDIVDKRLTVLVPDATGVGQYAGPAHQVHVHGEPAPLVGDDVCREHLEHIARHGRKTQMAVFWHGDLDGITLALAGRSGAMAAALVEDAAFRYVAPPAARPGRLSGPNRSPHWPTTEDPYGNRTG